MNCKDVLYPSETKQQRWHLVNSSQCDILEECRAYRFGKYNPDLNDIKLNRLGGFVVPLVVCRLMGRKLHVLPPMTENRKEFGINPINVNKQWDWITCMDRNCLHGIGLLILYKPHAQHNTHASGPFLFWYSILF